MNIYDDKEHIISSDEYSEDDDEDDSLMNDAIKAQGDIPFRVALADDTVKPKTKWRTEQKNMQLSSLIRSNKMFIIYKNRAIKWLNNKHQRERYKGNIYKNAISGTNLNSNSEPNATENKKMVANAFADVIDADKLEPYSKGNCNVGERTAGSVSDSNATGILREERAERLKLTKESTERRTGPEQKGVMKENEIIKKRGRSCSPINECEPKEKKIKYDTPQFYKKINEMFPKFDEIAKNHIDVLSNGTLLATEEKMKSIFIEIQTLNDIIHTKETEWNRLLHLKMIKEEIYRRLSRKKHDLELNENMVKTRNQRCLSELKELEMFLSDKKNLTIPSSCSNSSIQQIIENRANMKPEDLQRESNSTSRLHSLLVSRDVLPNVDTTDNYICNNGEPSFNYKPGSLNSRPDASYKLCNKTTMKTGRQGEFKDVKSIIQDFRQTNANTLPRDIKPNIQSQYTQVTKDRKHDFYSLKNSTEEVMCAPATVGKKIALSQDLVYNNSENGNYDLNLDESYKLLNPKLDFRISSPKGAQYPFCQECKIHESRFVCAGCGNQWYCSKICQISAWDKHSEICTE